ncbi:flagellar biosynthesis regulator FlaF [Methylocella tundrae]|uniref:Flagellar FlaF family protein n=1 Tax=Methylocella tundrae TaxID=227605 RepID=A0A4U8YTD3_METTU|nr:flagellar biosynthesis regulator FlaF [Methylocella tundrae]WPP04740.1 flagellar biosynthesis regulator FlaF [Methylocella tundrae]VFU06944.1 Flagellar FlaF family protein [Methylocella tundrae]
MYQLSYAESIEESTKECRERERRALDHAIALLEKAETTGPGTAVTGEALQFLCKLWKALIEDLINPENDLPDVLRGDLVSIGIWVLREADAIQAGRADGLDSLIEVCAMIRDGLK